MKSTDTSPFRGGLEARLPGYGFAAADLWRSFAVSPHAGGLNRWSKGASSRKQLSSPRLTGSVSDVEASRLFLPVLQAVPARPQRAESADQRASRCHRSPNPVKDLHSPLIGSRLTAVARARSRLGLPRSLTFPLLLPGDICRSFKASNRQSTHLTDKRFPLEAKPVSKPLESVKVSL